MKKLKINFAIKSRKGERDTNQDYLSCSYNRDGDFCAIISDGMGSIAHSEIASKVICDIFMTSFERTINLTSPTPWFKETLQFALNRINAVSIEKNCKGIAATLALLLIVKDKFYCYNIGDTRIYGINKDAIKQYTYDHNYRNFLISSEVSEETLNLAKAKWFSLTNYVDATNPKAAVFDVNSGNARDYKYFLLCTDGLYNFVDDKKKISISMKHLPLVLKSTWLNSSALGNGSKDNVSNILVKVK